LTVSKRQAGLTVVEVLVAVVILALAAVMFTYLINAFRFNRSAQRETGALNFARSYMESTRALWSDRELYRNAVLPEIPFPKDYQLDVTLADKEPTTGAVTKTFTCTSTAALTNTSGCTFKTYTNSTVDSITFSTSQLNPKATLREMTVQVSDVINSVAGTPKAKLSMLAVSPE